MRNDPNPVLAHELAHVAQQRQAPANAHPAAKLDGDSDHSAQERDADTAAAAILAGRPASVTPASSPRLAGFAPGHHRDATIRGLSQSFSANEIAAIYNANWERDFSQGAPEIANAVLAWKAVKRSATQNNGQPDPALAESFRNAVWNVVDMDVSESLDESLGGYHSWQHMDQPDEDAATEADERWGAAANGLAGYIADSKAYIKDHMVAAVDLFRSAQGRDRVGEDIDNWDGAERPEGYVAPAVESGDGGSTVTHLPRDWAGPETDSRAPLAAETTELAESQGAQSGRFAGERDERLWTLVGQHLGRAMHAFEDFWAHSNWLELAQELRAGERESVSNVDLETGTFGRASQVHALGHKLSAMADALLNDFDLLLAIYERDEASTTLDPDDRRAWYQLIDTDSEDAFDGLWAESSTLEGELFDVLRATNAMEEMVQSGDFEMADFLCNRDYLRALRDKGQRMIEHGAQEADEHAHGSIAKDQEEDGRDHEGAMALAAQANEQVFGPLRNIMEGNDTDRARDALLAQLERVDQMIAAPSPSHPLWSLVEPRGD